MSLAVENGVCGDPYQVPVKYPGRTLECKNCGSRMEVAKPSDVDGETEFPVGGQQGALATQSRHLSFLQNQPLPEQRSARSGLQILPEPLQGSACYPNAQPSVRCATLGSGG